MIDFWLTFFTVVGIPFLAITAFILWRHAARRATWISYPFYSFVAILCIGILLWTILPLWIPYNWSLPVAAIVMFGLIFYARHHYYVKFARKRKPKRKHDEIEDYEEV
jgi:hypothetical protein